MSETLSDPAPAGRGAWNAFTFALTIFAVVFAAALLGGLSRPYGFLATFWPANALLAGLLYRNPRAWRLPASVMAFIAFVLADLAVGDPVTPAVWFTLANLAGVFTITMLLDQLDPGDATLQRPQGVLFLLIFAAVGSSVAASVGCWAVPELTAQSVAASWMSWAASELGNYLSLLPVVLSAPTLGSILRKRQFTLPPIQLYWPQLLALSASLALTLVVRDQVSIVFPILALLWCALSFSVCATAILVMLYSDFAMLALRFDLINLGVEDTSGAIMSVHLALALVAMGPIMVSSANSARNALLKQLEKIARHDALTNALTRSAFYETADQMMGLMATTGAYVGVLVLDADHFKRVNDEHGHPAGDKVLVAISAAIQAAIRQSDVFGRVGGEEFAVVLPNVGHREATAIAERVRSSVEKLAVFLDDGTVLRTTLSVGVAHASAVGTNLDQMIAVADRALYVAKGEGRNRVAFLRDEEERGHAVS